MRGSSARRTLRLIATLAREPRHLPAYLRHLPLWKRAPIDLELPWFSYGSIRHLERWIRPEHRVFEYGSGGSTLFFGRRAREVVSVENDPGWHGLVTERLRRLGLDRVDCQLHPFGDAEAEGFAGLPYFQVLAPGIYDLIVVDGFCGYGTGGTGGRLRPFALAQACAAVRRPGLVVLDDAWMFPEAEATAGIRPLLFEGVGPCRYGVTSTAIFRCD